MNKVPKRIHYYRIQLVAYDFVQSTLLRLPLRIITPNPTPLPYHHIPYQQKRHPRKLRLLPFEKPTTR